MIGVLDSGMNGLGWSPTRGHCVVFLGKTLYSHSVSLHPSVMTNFVVASIHDVENG